MKTIQCHICSARDALRRAVSVNNLLTHPKPIDEVKEEETRPRTPSSEDPTARGPTPDPTPAEPPAEDCVSGLQPHPKPPLPRSRRESSCSGVSCSSRTGPKDKGVKAPLSVEARFARRNKERNKRRAKRLVELAKRRECEEKGAQSLADGANNSSPSSETPNPPTTPNTTPSPTPTPTTTRNPSQSLLSPGEVYGEVSPQLTVTVTRQGAGTGARSSIVRALLFAAEDYTIGPLSVVTDGVSFSVGDDGSLRVVRDVLEADGWVVDVTPIWNRYSFNVPVEYQDLPLDDLIQGILRRNGRQVRGPEGIPENSIRSAGVLEEGGEGGNGQPRRVRAWVDVSPEAEEYLRAHSFLIRVVSSAVRLRPSASSHSAPGRS